MEKIVVKKEPEEVISDSDGDISMNYDKPGPTSADQEMPSTSGIAIKQEIKEELDDNSNSMVYDESEVKEEPKTFTDDDDYFDEAELVEVKFDSEERMLLYKGTNSEVVKEKLMPKIVLPKAGKKLRKNPVSGSVRNNFDVYECKHCSIQFFNEEAFESHEERCLKPRVRVHTGKMFECDYCPKKYQAKRSLLQHKKYVHKQDEQDQLKCGKCNYQTFIKSNYKKHLKTHEKEKYLKCKFCQFMAAQLSALNAHILRKHTFRNTERSKTKIIGKILLCTNCPYSTRIKTHYDYHIKLCLKLKNVQWYECDICHFRTIQKCNLKSHKKMHHDK
ncbi:unnamed protein product [Brassicogethes aeneus]|uniref:C2H2-type domain-containing protein n=1 Tax=Brassicogethes aeneus TaxID=1431903 RepID=A0A9P0FM04_BRAAE|nr:unnamed protein product [Brassicogethes aeneus]